MKQALHTYRLTFSKFVTLLNQVLGTYTRRFFVAINMAGGTQALSLVQLPTIAELRYKSQFSPSPRVLILIAHSYRLLEN